VREAFGTLRGSRGQVDRRRVHGGLRRAGARDPLRPVDRRCIGGAGIQVRAGVHTGECEVMGERHRRNRRHIARVSGALAGPSESRLARHGQGPGRRSRALEFNRPRARTRSSVPDTWQLYRRRAKRGDYALRRGDTIVNVIDPLERWRGVRRKKPDYAGLLSFGGVPYTEDAAEAGRRRDVAIVGAPVDDLVSTARARALPLAQSCGELSTGSPSRRRTSTPSRHPGPGLRRRRGGPG